MNHAIARDLRSQISGERKDSDEAQRFALAVAQIPGSEIDQPSEWTSYWIGAMPLSDAAGSSAIWRRSTVRKSSMLQPGIRSLLTTSNPSAVRNCSCTGPVYQWYAVN